MGKKSTSATAVAEKPIIVGVAEEVVTGTVEAKAAPKKPAAPKQPKVHVRIVDNGGQGLALHIPSHALRSWAQGTLVPYSVIPYDFIYDGDETPAQKKALDARSIFRLAPFFSSHCTQQLARYAPQIGKQKGELAEAITQLWSLLKEKRAEFETNAKVAIEANSMDFDELIYFFQQPEVKMIVNVDGHDIYGKVTEVEIRETMFGRLFEANLNVYGWNGTQFVSGQHELFFREYEGKKSFEDLRMKRPTPELLNQLVERGKRYVSLVEKPSYVQHAGNLIRMGWFGPMEFNANGRVMLDMAGFSRVEPNYHGWFAGVSPSREENRYSRQRGSTALKPADLESPEALASMIHIVYGFSFVSKMWGQMYVDRLSPIQFRANAWDQLVLDAENKDLLLSIVGASNLHSTDFIDGKGGGAIFLLYGPPGCGKTLTAEASAEVLQRPLYSVGIGELGTNVDQLERNLTRILETAASWGAILLLDEADIFLEERNDNDVERNALVGVFLRLLEYYPGILFLTSNRAQRLDPAFYSRISLALHYDRLDLSARRQVWTNLLSLPAYVNNVKITTEEIALLAEHEKLNGRQIKNVVRLAVVWAKEQKLPYADYGTIEKVISKVQDFNPRTANDLASEINK